MIYSWFRFISACVGAAAGSTEQRLRRLAAADLGPGGRHTARHSLAAVANYVDKFKRVGTVLEGLRCHYLRFPGSHLTGYGRTVSAAACRCSPVRHRQQELQQVLKKIKPATHRVMLLTEHCHGSTLTRRQSWITLRSWSNTTPWLAADFYSR